MITMYWADKALFLRHYRLPRRYGRKLAKRVVEIMKWAIILHLFFGLYMISNPDIFTYENIDLSEIGWSKGYVKSFSKGFTYVFGVETTRFNQIHTVLYILGITLFLLLFLIEECTGFFGTFVGGCLNLLDADKKTKTFSNDIYKELSAEDQLYEYQNINTAIKHVEYRLFRGDAANPALYKYFL